MYNANRTKFSNRTIIKIFIYNETCFFNILPYNIYFGRDIFRFKRRNGRNIFII